MSEDAKSNEEKIKILEEELSRLRDDLDFYQIDHGNKIEDLERRMNEVINAVNNILKKI